MVFRPGAASTEPTGGRNLLRRRTQCHFLPGEPLAAPVIASEVRQEPARGFGLRKSEDRWHIAAPHCSTSLGARAGYWRGQPWGQENGKKCAVHHQGWVHGAFIKKIYYFLVGLCWVGTCSSFIALEWPPLHLTHASPLSASGGSKSIFPCLVAASLPRGCSGRILHPCCPHTQVPGAPRLSQEILAERSQRVSIHTMPTDGVGKSPRGRARHVLLCQGDFFSARISPFCISVLKPLAEAQGQ